MKVFRANAKPSCFDSFKMEGITKKMDKLSSQNIYIIDVLPLFYKRLFPHELLYRWLCYGNPLTFAKREISFTLVDDVYIRYQSFDTLADFLRQLYRKYPIKLDIGAIYETKPKDKSNISHIIPVEKEIFFDIDLTDYDDVRYCCSGTDACAKCWRYMAVACSILDVALRQDFGYKNILWVFSGRRGIHCWVCDEDARKIGENARSMLADYLCLVKGGSNIKKKVKLPGERIHSSIERALNIVEETFPHILEEQDILGTEERINKFLELVDQDLRQPFKTGMERGKDSIEKWQCFQRTFNDMIRNDKIPKHLKNLVAEIKLHYLYPRLDINVTKGFIHLLKSPFSVHIKTGKIAIPFDPKKVKDLNPETVPTIPGLIDEIEAYSKKLKETNAESKDPLKIIKDYEKTSLLGPIKLFEQFLNEIENSKKIKKCACKHQAADCSSSQQRL